MRAGVRRRIAALKRAWANRPFVADIDMDIDILRRRVNTLVEMTDGSHREMSFAWGELYADVGGSFPLNKLPFILEALRHEAKMRFDPPR